MADDPRRGVFDPQIVERLHEKLEEAVAAKTAQVALDPAKLLRIVDGMRATQQALAAKALAYATADSFAEALADALLKGVSLADLVILTSQEVPGIEGLPFPVRVSKLVPEGRALLINRRAIEATFVNIGSGDGA